MPQLLPSACSENNIYEDKRAHLPSTDCVLGTDGVLGALLSFCPITSSNGVWGQESHNTHGTQPKQQDAGAEGLLWGCQTRAAKPGLWPQQPASQPCYCCPRWASTHRPVLDEGVAQLCDLAPRQ